MNKIETTQTAVEWLVNQVNSDCLNSTFIRPELIKEAKAMEKEQMMDAAKVILFASTGPGDAAAERYYNETYNK